MPTRGNKRAVHDFHPYIPESCRRDTGSSPPAVHVIEQQTYAQVAGATSGVQDRGSLFHYANVTYNLIEKLPVFRNIRKAMKMIQVRVPRLLPP